MLLVLMKTAKLLFPCHLLFISWDAYNVLFICNMYQYMHTIRIHRWHSTNSVLSCVTGYGIKLIIIGYPLLISCLTNILHMSGYIALKDLISQLIIHNSKALFLSYK